jgi:Type II CAAX prenyl endopeptidase Rce1-like
MEQDAAAQDEVNARGSNLGSLRGARRDWLEIGIAYALILAVVWTPRPVQRWLWIVAVVGVAILLWRSFESWRAMGFTAANFGRSLWIVGAALGVAVIAVVVAARLHTLHLPPGGLAAFVATYIAYAIWTGVQEFLLQGFFLLRLLRVTPKAVLAALVAAAMFAAAHLPNPILTPATLLWGFLACLLFVRYRNLYPLAMAHAILGITVAITVPGPVVHNMRVGLGYLTYNPHMHRRVHRSEPHFSRPAA